MKSDIWKDTVPQSFYFKSRLDLGTLGGVGGGNLKSWKTLGIRTRMKFGGENKHKS